MSSEMISRFEDEDDFTIELPFDNQKGCFDLYVRYWPVQQHGIRIRAYPDVQLLLTWNTDPIATVILVDHAFDDMFIYWTL